MERADRPGGIARRLRDAGIPFEIVLVGDGPFRELVENAIRDANLESAITITGWASGARVKEEIAAPASLCFRVFTRACRW